MIEELTRALDALKQTGNTAEDTKKAIQAIDTVMKGLGTSLEVTGNIFGATFSKFSDAINASNAESRIRSLSDALELFGGDIKSMSEILKGVPLVGGIFETAGTAVEESMKILGAFNEEMFKVVGSFDQSSEEIRRMEMNFGSLGTRMGMTFEETQKFTREFQKLQAFSNEDFFIEPKEIEAATVALGRQSISFEELAKSVDIAGMSMSKQEAVLMTSRAAGEDLRETTRFIGDSMMKSGMSFENAIKQYGVLRDVTKSTGIQIDDVKTALTGAVSGFENMGAKMSFAQPIFEGFVNSLKKVGLGIKLASEQARQFVSSMLNMTSSYENMFLLAQRGGLQTGGSGSLLGSSIGMRARMLEAEESGDQASIGLEMAESLKNTLASFTGGEIVTLKEAAESPELEQTFYMQEQLLSQFGISGKNAERTLELLSEIDQASAIGDDESAQQLAESLNEQMNNQDATLNETEKQSRLLANMSAQLSYGNELSYQMIEIRRAEADVLGAATFNINKRIMDLTKQYQDAVMSEDNTNLKAISDELIAARKEKADIIEKNSANLKKLSDESEKEKEELKGKRRENIVVTVKFTGKAEELFEKTESVVGVIESTGDKLTSP